MTLRSSIDRLLGTLKVGTVLKGYSIEGVLGQDRFGIVYSARHRELGARVAIKEYFPAELAVRVSGLVGPRSSQYRHHFEEGFDRFLKKGLRWVLIREHPNVVSCRDLIRQNGTVYMVMDYVDGVSLSEMLSRREAQGHPFTEDDLMAVILPLLDGLQHIHDEGIVHYDIKPSNIIIRANDEQPVLIDFGAAMQGFAEYASSLAPNSDGYAAIEQVGEGQIGAWTDVYSLGAVMWRIVAGGNPPWTPPKPVNVQTRAMDLLRGKGDTLPPASGIGNGRFTGKVLKAIDACVSINAEERLQTAGDLTRRLTADAGAPSIRTTPAPGAKAKASAPRLRRKGKRPNTGNGKAGGRRVRSRWRRVWQLLLLCLLCYLSYGVFILFMAGPVRYFSPAGIYEIAMDNSRYDDGSRTANLLERAAEKGYAKAQATLGYLYEYGGFGIEVDGAQAAYWYRRAAGQGNAEGEAGIGSLYLNGIDTLSASEFVARTFFHRAAKNGSPRANLELGYLYLQGRGGLSRDKTQADRRFAQADAGFDSGYDYLMRPRFEYEMMVHGLTNEQVSSGNLRVDLVFSAIRFDAAGQALVGQVYEHGVKSRYGSWDIEPNDVEAAKWYRLSADQGNADGLFDLGRMFLFGRGVPQDPEEAKELMRRSAALGNWNAQAHLDAM